VIVEVQDWLAFPVCSTVQAPECLARTAPVRVELIDRLLSLPVPAASIAAAGP